MEIFAIWLVLAIVIGAIAGTRDRSGFGWFLLALFSSPLIAGILLLAVGERRPRRCPHCDERIKERAKICPHCRSDLSPAVGAAPPSPAMPHVAERPLRSIRD